MFKPPRPASGMETSASKQGQRSSKGEQTRQSKSSNTKQKSTASTKPPGSSKKSTATATADDLPSPIDIDSADDNAPQPAPASAPALPHSPPAGQTIPPVLLSRILHEFFEASSETRGGGEVRISSAAVAAVGEYARWFVKEAIARSAIERRRIEEKAGRGTGTVDVEVEDLERVAAQLVLDF